jgi:sterol desaturase/sphingolipid hydroxylase (fatty acid hydroxylase superfamily)
MSVFLAFVLLVAFTFACPIRRAKLWLKSREDWILDSVGLFLQGILIPLLQMTVVYQFYRYLFPFQEGCLHLSAIGAFLLNFVVLDYLYYWNHRCLHGTLFWKLHQVHHTVSEMDVLGTSRNTIWTSFFLVYLWGNAFWIFLLQDPTGYIIGMSLTSVLDLWRHSPLRLSRKSWLYSLLSTWLILPQDHAWHHAVTNHCNYGANLKIWDNWHGTNWDDNPEKIPVILGLKLNLSLAQKLIYPFSD